MVPYNGGKVIVMMAAGSILGLLYVLLLPLAWIVAAPVLLMKKIVVSLADLAERSAAVGWRPMESYLTGKKNKKKADKDKP
ncbi:MAG: hypothetical protein A2010_10305 [Nitrospirae bacterium GWD2_57_9]|nr:MAG: hypothetical protein A2010_10305 [Nitrospirae bacterium GWD2_57_9]